VALVLGASALTWVPAHAWSDNGASCASACGEHESHRAVLLTPVADAHLDLTPTPAINGMVVKMQDADLHAIEGKRIEFHTGNELLCTAFTNEEGYAECNAKVELNFETVFAILGQAWTARFNGDGTYLPVEAHGNLSLTAAGKPDEW